MFSGEWALIIFSILAQCAVGTWLVAVILRILIAKRSDLVTASQLTWRAILVAGPFMSIALVISILHLGSPMLAYSSIGNFGSSWLSREIVFSGLFLFLWITTYINYRKANTGNTLTWVASILGLLAVFSMASIYYSTPIPAWATVNTYIGFFATTIILGSIVSATFVGLTAKRFLLNQEVRKLLWKLSLVVLTTVILQLFFLALKLVNLTGGIGAGLITALLLQKTYSFPLLFHGLLLFVGSCVFMAYWYQYSKKPTQAMSHPAFYISIALIFVGEVIGRYLFYASASALPMIG